MKFSDDELMAYADGELDLETRAHIEAALIDDPEMADKVARHRRLQERLHVAYAPVLAETVPERLSALVGGAHLSEAGPSTVVSLDAARHERSQRAGRRWRWLEWGAIAASLVVGLVAGDLLSRSGSNDVIAAEGGELFARGALASVLSDQLAGERSAGPVHVGLSFLAKSGDYCRTFTMTQQAARTDALAGIACHQGNAWELQTLARTSKGEDSEHYRQAGSPLPESVLRAVDESIQGEPLDADAERAARERGWRR